MSLKLKNNFHCNIRLNNEYLISNMQLRLTFKKFNCDSLWSIAGHYSTWCSCRIGAIRHFMDCRRFECAQSEMNKIRRSEINKICLFCCCCFFLRFLCFVLFVCLFVLTKVSLFWHVIGAILKVMSVSEKNKDMTSNSA